MAFAQSTKVQKMYLQRQTSKLRKIRLLFGNKAEGTSYF